MPLDVLPDDGIIVKTREQFRSLWLRSLKIRNPQASIEQDTQPWIDASVMADILAPMSLNARTIGRSIPLSEVSGPRLDQRLTEYGLPARFPETGSQGSVSARTSSTGATIQAGTECVDQDSGLRFKCVVTGHYADASSIPIAAIDTGTQTNLPAGTVLIWSQGVPGLFSTCVVIEQTDGSGLSGGRAEESDDEVRNRISSALANPASAGNDAAYQRLVENSRGHGVSVQKCFTYPACNGPGTIGVAFTMKPATAGGSRRPNSTQMAIVQAYVIGQMPADDTYLPVSLVQQKADIVLEVSWATGASNWADVAPWPPRANLGSGAYRVTNVISPVLFDVYVDNAIYSGTTAPVAGQNIALWDGSKTGAFRQKRILSVTGSGPWTCQIDTTNGASDTTFAPTDGDRVMPWSDSLGTLVDPIVSYFGTFGPGEQQTTFFDPGLRQKRNPPAPKQWPYAISSKIETGILDLTSVNDVVVATGLGLPTLVGISGSYSYLLELGSVSVFPL